MNRSIIEEVRMSKLLNVTELSRKDYLCELRKMSDKIAALVLDVKDGQVKTNEVIAHLECEARTKGLKNEPVTKKGLTSLGLLSKEISICISGSNAESRVNKMLQYTGREDMSNYQNIYLSGGGEETELDNVIVTKNGLILTEIKGTKKNVTITPEGRLVYGEDECYEKNPLGTKMETKRSLLRETLQNRLQEKGMNIPIMIESYVVFSIPRDVKIEICDLYKRENICTGKKLKYIVSQFSSEYSYTNDQLKVINEVLSEMETEQKMFKLEYDFRALFEDVVDLVKVLEDADKREYEKVQTNYKARLWMKISKVASEIAEKSAMRAGTTVEICRKGAA